MRIGIDARELCGRPTGVGRYLAGLLEAWASGSDVTRHEFVLYAPGAIALAPESLDSRRFTTRLVSGSGGTWWEQAQLPSAAARDHLDVFFSPGYSAALFRRTPVVVAIHDISFVAHPEWFTHREGIRRRWFTRQTALQAAAVVTISEFSRGEIVQCFSLPADRVHVIPPGLSNPLNSSKELFHGGTVVGQESSHVAQDFSPVTVPTVLFVGTILNRRRLPDLIRAFAPIARNHSSATLVIAGDNRSYPRQDLSSSIAQEGLASAVQLKNYVPESELAGLYARSRVFAFLSEYEGLGLTPLEALAAGVPPVLLDTPVARESCGDAALYVKRGDISGTTTALAQLLFDDSVRNRLLARAPDVLARYDWNRCATETLAVLERASR